jgi:hypothetical protein
VYGLIALLVVLTLIFGGLRLWDLLSNQPSAPSDTKNDQPADQVDSNSNSAGDNTDVSDTDEILRLKPRNPDILYMDGDGSRIRDFIREIKRPSQSERRSVSEQHAEIASARAEIRNSIIQSTESLQYWEQKAREGDQVALAIAGDLIKSSSTEDSLNEHVLVVRAPKMELEHGRYVLGEGVSLEDIVTEVQEKSLAGSIIETWKEQEGEFEVYRTPDDGAFHGDRNEKRYKQQGFISVTEDGKDATLEPLGHFVVSVDDPCKGLFLQYDGNKLKHVIMVDRDHIQMEYAK